MKMQALSWLAALPLALIVHGAAAQANGATKNAAAIAARIVVM